jgi:hypothetical protein
MLTYLYVYIQIYTLYLTYTHALVHYTNIYTHIYINIHMCACIQIMYNDHEPQYTDDNIMACTIRMNIYT